MAVYYNQFIFNIDLDLQRPDAYMRNAKPQCEILNFDQNVLYSTKEVSSFQSRPLIHFNLA
jgi:hypothetical protein